MDDSASREPSNDDDGLHRRNILRLMGGVGLGLGVAGAGAAVASSAADAAPATEADPIAAGKRLTPSCVLSPEVDEGPFYLDLETVRRDITEDRVGVPLTLRFAVVNALTCERIPNAAVDIWHCDAGGTYSGYATPDPNSPPPPGIPPGGGPPPGGFPHQEPINDLTFLRGVQLTDRHGVAEMRTVYPGWYQGRAVHFHVKVHVSGTVVGTKYQGGHVSHTGQLYMPEAKNVEIARLEPYRSNPIIRVTNNADPLYVNFDGAGSEFTLEGPRRDAADLRRHGLSGHIVLGVDPNAVPATS